MDDYSLRLVSAANSDEVTSSDECHPHDQEVGYVSRWFVQALFPYRRTDALTRQVTNGPNRITVMSANGLPYGKFPRLIMAYIITTAVERAGDADRGLLTIEEARRLPLGRTMNGFLEAIGLEKRGSGGERGALTAIRTQLGRLTSSTITVQKLVHKRAQGVNAPIASSWDLWFDPVNPDQTSMTESYIELTETFFQQILEAPIPIDLHILQKLNKPRAMDVYVWLTLKKYWLAKTGRNEFTFEWSDLANNFSTKPLTTTREVIDFRTEMRKSVERIEQYWPDVGVSISTSGLTLETGSTSVPMKPSRRSLPR